MSMDDDLNPNVDDSNSNVKDKGDDNSSPDALLKALQHERATLKAAKDALKQATDREQQYETKLKQFQDIDPQKYQDLLKRQQTLEEEDLTKSKQWEALKTKYQAEQEKATGLANTWKGQYETLKIQTAIGQAFTSAGGKTDVDISEEGESIAPMDVIVEFFSKRTTLEDGKLVLLDKHGNPETTTKGMPKTLGEKMIELKRSSSMGALFEPVSKQSGTGSQPSMTAPNGQKLIVYTQEQARSGKADMAKIASGEAIVR